MCAHECGGLWLCMFEYMVMVYLFPVLLSNQPRYIESTIKEALGCSSCFLSLQIRNKQAVHSKLRKLSVQCCEVIQNQQVIKTQKVTVNNPQMTTPETCGDLAYWIPTATSSINANQHKMSRIYHKLPILLSQSQLHL